MSRAITISPEAPLARPDEMNRRQVCATQGQTMYGCRARVADDGLEALGRSHHAYSIGHFRPPVQIGLGRVHACRHADKLPRSHLTPDVGVGPALAHER